MKQLLFALSGLILLSSCSKEESPFSEPAKNSIYEKSVTDLAIDSSNSGVYTLFNLETGQVVPNSDSATDKWHIGFLSTTIIVNSGSSGPGNTQTQLVNGIYDEYNTAPETGYKTDMVSGKAIPTGSGNGWYNYNDQLHIITPIPGRIICFKTTDSKFCKMEITSYYKGSPAAPTYDMPARYYNFRYVYQKSGSRQFN